MCHCIHPTSMPCTILSAFAFSSNLSVCIISSFVFSHFFLTVLDMWPLQQPVTLHYLSITDNKDETMHNKTEVIQKKKFSLEKPWLYCHKRLQWLGPHPVVLCYVTLYTPPTVKYNHFKYLIRNHCDNPVCTARGRLRDLESGLRKSAEDSAESQSLLRFAL